MRLWHIPFYCGGGVLTGFWPNTTYTPKGHFDEIKALEDRILVEGGGIENFFYGPKKNGHNSSTANYLINEETSDFLFNKQMLKYLIKRRYNNCVGVITAITNRDQSDADPFLISAGFNLALKTNKLGFDISKCNYYIGDYHKDIKPILNKIPDYIFEDKVRIENAKF